MINPRDLCLALVRCESEQEVIGVLEKENLWSNQALWQAFSGEENNFSIIGNQQSKPEAALVEKLTNAVDAVLMSECLARGVDPESLQAPQSMSAALSTYFGITDGKLTNITATTRSKLAERILLVATGSRQTPNYAIIDKGEGQSPARLQDTILSLKKSNKLRIPFVQGKFNMGGTGVFRFCGERNLQLIVSKRNPQISNHETDFDAGKWGFTIVRREDPRGGMRSSSYTYLAPANRIINFEAQSLPILPGVYPEAYQAELVSGTYIKLFEYKIGPSLRTNILFDLYNRLALFLPHIALPIKLCERREKFSGHSFETVLAGLSVRVDEDRSENVESPFPATGTMHVQGQLFVYSIYVFKKGAHKKFTKDEGILFTLNGQTHAILSKQFFDRKAVGLSYIADSTMVILDCSNIDGRAREDLFLNSRDRLGDCPLRLNLEKELEDILKNHPGLRAIKDRRRQEELQNRLSEQQPLRNVLQNILQKSPTLARLFISGISIEDPFATTGARPAVEFTGKEFPTFFTATKKYTLERPKAAHIGAKFRVEFATDANNDYFQRDKDPGAVTIFIDGRESPNAAINLWNGVAHLNARVDGYAPGAVLEVRCEVNDVSRVMPLVEGLFVTVLAEEAATDSPPGKRKPPASNKPGEGASKQGTLALPNVIEIDKGDWAAQNFNEGTALVVKGSPQDGYDFYINVDNKYLRAELVQGKPGETEAVRAKFKFGLVLVGLALLNGSEEQGSGDDPAVDRSDFRKIESVTSALAPIVVPMIDSLGAIDEELTRTVRRE